MENVIHILTALSVLSICPFGQSAGSQVYNREIVAGHQRLSPPPSAADQALGNSLWTACRDTLKKARALVNANDAVGAIPLFDKAKELDAKAASLFRSAPNPVAIEEEKLIALGRYLAAASLLESGSPGVTEEAWLTILYYRMGDKSMARDAFRKAFYNGENLGLSAHEGLGEFLMLNGVTDETMRATALMFIGQQINGDYSRPMDEMRLLREANNVLPGNPFITYSIGSSYLHNSQYGQALPYLKAAETTLKGYVEQSICEASRHRCQDLLAGQKSAW